MLLQTCVLLLSSLSNTALPLECVIYIYTGILSGATYFKFLEYVEPV